jgi:hypothetical protein
MVSESTSKGLEGKFMLKKYLLTIYIDSEENQAKFSISSKKAFHSFRYAKE